MSGTVGSRVRLCEDVILSGSGSNGYATILATGATYHVNETAAFVIEHAADLVHAVERLVEAYPDVPRAEIERDVSQVVDECLRLGVLESC